MSHFTTFGYNKLSVSPSHKFLSIFTQTIYKHLPTFAISKHLIPLKLKHSWNSSMYIKFSNISVKLPECLRRGGASIEQ